jgi:hypothetical protein
MATKFTNWFLGKPKERKHMGYGALLHFKRPRPTSRALWPSLKSRFRSLHSTSISLKSYTAYIHECISFGRAIANLAHTSLKNGTTTLRYVPKLIESRDPSILVNGCS